MYQGTIPPLNTMVTRKHGDPVSVFHGRICKGIGSHCSYHYSQYRACCGNKNRISITSEYRRPILKQHGISVQCYLLREKRIAVHSDCPFIRDGYHENKHHRQNTAQGKESHQRIYDNSRQSYFFHFFLSSWLLKQRAVRITLFLQYNW